jgi:recombination protein RecA
MAKKKTQAQLDMEALAFCDQACDYGCLTFDEILPIPRLDTGIPELTTMLGGGWPKSRIVELYAVEGIGKTSIALQSCAIVQQAFQDGTGLRAAYIDIENKYDPYYAKNQFGIIHPKNLGTKKKPIVEDNGYRIYRVKTQEEASNLIDRLVRSKRFDIIVPDSAAAMCPKAEFEGEIGNIKARQAQARIMSQHMRKVNGPVADGPATVLYINQSRVVGTGQRGQNLYEAPGAKAFKHFAAMRVSMWRGKAIKQGSSDTAPTIGNLVGVRIVKNQCGPEQNVKGFLRFYHGEGYCRFSETLEFAVAYEILDKSGSWYKYKGKNIAQGWRALREWAGKFETTFDKIKEEVESAQANDREISIAQEDDADFSF